MKRIKKITEGKIYSPSGKFAERAKQNGTRQSFRLQTSPPVCTHDVYLLMFIVEQNVVGISAVILAVTIFSRHLAIIQRTGAHV